MDDLICTQCGAPYANPNTGRGRPPSTCSSACRKEKLKQKSRSAYYKYGKRLQEQESVRNWNRLMVCQFCYGEYLRKDGGYKYCSTSCSNKAMGYVRNSNRRASKIKAPFFNDVTFSAIWERDKGQCQHCLKFLDRGKRGTQERDSPEVDHIIPLSRGGVQADFNCQILCRGCNVKKGNKIYTTDKEKSDALWPDDVSRQLDAGNKRKPKLITPGGSGYRGVTKSGNHWRYKIECNGVKYRGYGYDSPRAAAIAYNEKVKELGLSARKLNEISDG